MAGVLQDPSSPAHLFQIFNWKKLAVTRDRTLLCSKTELCHVLPLPVAENEEKLVLYGMMCGCLAFIAALIAFIGRMFYVRYRKAQRCCAHQKLNITEPALQVSVGSVSESI